MHNPYLHKIHYSWNTLKELIPVLKNESFDAILDLHKNRHSRKIVRALQVKAYTFPKKNVLKWLMVNFKFYKVNIDHVVFRYMQSISHWGITYDGQGLDIFLSEQDHVVLPASFSSFVAIVIGAQHGTKQIPAEKIIEIIRLINFPVVLIGGADDQEKGERIKQALPESLIFNAAGKFTILQSASLLLQSKTVITGDTGMMHIAAALRKPVVSVWGSTVPEFGMTPLFPSGSEVLSTIVENKHLSCRPCSKLGFSKCPRRHFRCMNDLNVYEIISGLNK
jgi:ADP-heptose:LPS heptosyltransferase